MSIPLPVQSSQFDADQAIKFSYNDNANVLQVMNGFLLAKNGRSIAVAYPNGTTETYTYKESDATTIMVITVVYTDSTKANISTVTRTA